MNEVLLRTLVWTDYRLAVIFTVLMPIALLIWALLKKSDAVSRLLVIYWRVASLLMITLYLMSAAWGVGFISGVAAKILIPISLWFWADINEEIKDMPQRGLKLAITAWRWAITVYCTLGVILIAPALSCAVSNGVFAVPNTFSCQIWLEAPKAYKNLFHADSREGFLGFLGMCGLISYLLYLVYFLLIRLGRQGRSALEQ